MLDYHSRGSDFLGYDEYGKPRFDTERTEVGELLFQLKYRGRKDALAKLVRTATNFIRRWKPPTDSVVPVPPSKPRVKQPTRQLAREIARSLNLPFDEAVTRTERSKQLKDVFDYHERMKLLENAHDVTGTSLDGKSVLLVDDLYRSGATLNAVTDTLYTKGKVSAVYAFALTRTRRAS